MANITASQDKKKINFWLKLKQTSQGYLTRPFVILETLLKISPGGAFLKYLKAITQNEFAL